MCDTIGITQSGSGAWFAKNSDRSPNEPQVLEFIPAVRHEEKTLKATYIEIEQAAETCSLLLSRPVWLWGGEMGVNEYGVAIGNEAVFTKGPYGPEALTGMDLLRLGLERSHTAAEAADVIISMLERYGQGGNCGYDHRFEYDNSFLIMDRGSLFVLETAGKRWALKQSASNSISNRLCLDSADRSSAGEEGGFAEKYSDPLFTRLSGSGERRSQTQAYLGGNPGVSALTKALRTHVGVKNPFARGSVKSVCMHAGGLVGDHTTQSMIADLSGETPLIWSTGCSTPCAALFKPWLFGSKNVPPVFEPGDENARKYWLRRELLVRRFRGAGPPAEYYAMRDAIEEELFALAEEAASRPADMAHVTLLAFDKEEAFLDYWAEKPPAAKAGSPRFRRYWAKKDAALKAINKL